MRDGPNSQLKVKFDQEVELRYLEYTEDVSKTNQGGLDHRKVNWKVVRVYENKANPHKCVVGLYLKYLSVRPKQDSCPNDLYLRPLAAPKGDVWFTFQPMGCNKLSSIVADMAKRIGLEGKITNHSLRATAASRLYHQKLDEQLVMERTGHRSTSVRSYKRTSANQLREISDVLYGQELNPPKRHHETAVSRCQC